jgi:hypothetical protein
MMVIEGRIMITIHSITDLITNSSTTIYTHSDRSPKTMVDMIDGIFRVFGIDKKCDDVFDLSVELRDAEDISERVIDYLCDEPSTVPEDFYDQDVDEDLLNKLDNLYNDIYENDTKKPDWLVAAEKAIIDNMDYVPSTVLQITAKQPEYEELCDLITSFLYSTSHSAGYN